MKTNDFDFNNINYRDEIVHIFGSTFDGVTETVTIVAYGGGELAGAFLEKWQFKHSTTSVAGLACVSFTSDKGDALQCFFDAVTARRFGELYIT